MLLRWLDEKANFKRVVVGVTASPHARLAVDIAKALESELKAACRYLHVIRRGTRMDRATEEAFLKEKDGGPAPLDLEVVQARTTSAGILEASKDADLLILGAAREGIVNQLVLGEKTRSVARRAKTAVLLVQRRPSKGLSLLRRLFTQQT